MGGDELKYSGGIHREGRGGIIGQGRYIVEILEKFEIENWTIIRDVVGKIGSVFKYEGEISANSYIFFTCKEDKFYKVLQELKEFINKFGGLLIYYDIKSI